MKTALESPKTESLEFKAAREFYKKFEDYNNTYSWMLLIDGISNLTETVSEAVHKVRPKIIEQTSPERIKELYAELRAFEQKCPFVEEKLYDKALKLEELTRCLDQKVN
jgi:hypothetical protein